MLDDLLRQYRDIVVSWSVAELDHEGRDVRFKARVVFQDKSVLHIRQTVIDGSLLKYAYHWQDREGVLCCRWDNTRHWKDVTTFPSHKHIGSKAELLPDAGGGDLSVVMAEIAGMLR